ncbi:MAG: alpha/beta hydrolase [Acidobacteriota bacterium]
MRVDIGGCGIEVEDRGKGMAVVLLHGFPLGAGTWTPIRPGVAQAARLITPDLRGFGRSDKPAGCYSMDALADDVAAIADALGLDRFVLGGHSMGGYVALAFAERHPHRLAGLILIDTRAEADTAEGLGRRRAVIERVRRDGGAGFLDEFVPNLLCAATRARAPRHVAELRAIAAEVPDHVLIGCQQGMMARHDRLSLLPALDVPALVLVGQDDTITPPEASRAMAAALPRATLVVIPEAGHSPMVERPMATADAIVTFLRGIPPEAVES